MKFFALLCLISSSLVFANSFTPDHLEGRYAGSSLSDPEPDYCRIKMKRIESEDNVNFQIVVIQREYNSAIFEADYEAVEKQLARHSSYVELDNNEGYLQINIGDSGILNFLFQERDTQNKVTKQIICSRKR